MWRALVLACMMVFSAITHAGAQQSENQPNQILVIDTDLLFNQSQFGQTLVRNVELEGRELATENRGIESELAEEEELLTELRATMEAAEFRVLADTFDQKVQATREQQLNKSKALSSKIDRQRVTFLNAAAPVLQALMREAGALVLLERRNVILSAATVDITTAAVAQIDSVLGDGTQPTISGD